MGNNNIIYIEVFCNSDYASDKQTRVSVSGYIHYLCNVPVARRSKAQKSVTPSSSEAAFVSLREAAKEVKFIVQVIESMEIKVKKPVTIGVENIGVHLLQAKVITVVEFNFLSIQLRINFLSSKREYGLYSYRLRILWFPQIVGTFGKIPKSSLKRKKIYLSCDWTSYTQYIFRHLLTHA